MHAARHRAAALRQRRTAARRSATDSTGCWPTAAGVELPFVEFHDDSDAASTRTRARRCRATPPSTPCARCWRCAREGLRGRCRSRRTARGNCSRADKSGAACARPRKRWRGSERSWAEGGGDRAAAGPARSRSVRRRRRAQVRGPGVTSTAWSRPAQPRRADIGSACPTTPTTRRTPHERRHARQRRADDDAYLDLPLSGVRLIEASAGTGKTFTLATLVTRLVVERGLRIGQVLAVTFTEAATQELRKRIRERLQLASTCSPRAGRRRRRRRRSGRELPGNCCSRISHRQRREPTTPCAAACARPTLEIDLAAIFTIHGFCARVLREHALESGQGFDPPELLANDRALREALAADLWRSHASDDDRRRRPGRAVAQAATMRWPRPAGPAARAGAAAARRADAAGSDAGAARGRRARWPRATDAHGEAFRADRWPRRRRQGAQRQQLRRRLDPSAVDAAVGAGARRGDTGRAAGRTHRADCCRRDAAGQDQQGACGRTPDSPLCDVVPPYLEAMQAQAD